MGSPLTVATTSFDAGVAAAAAAGAAAGLAAAFAGLFAAWACAATTNAAKKKLNMK